MRKIISKEEEEKREKRNRRFVGFLLLGIMVLSVFGIVVDSIGKTDSSSSAIVYNGVEFSNQAERWFFSYDGLDFSIINSPQNLTNITSNELNNFYSYSDKPLYIYSKDSTVIYNLASNMEKVAYRLQYACLSKEECLGDYPLKTCEDNFIILQEGNEPSIIQDQNCVRITGPKDQLQKLTDTFLLKILGIN
jgi:hypothetical protein